MYGADDYAEVYRARCTETSRSTHLMNAIGWLIFNQYINYNNVVCCCVFRSVT